MNSSSSSSSLQKYNSQAISSSSNKKRKIVLDEDNYIEKLESVIEQQFFPHLPKLRSQLEYLECNELFDIKTLKQTYHRLFPYNQINSISSQLNNSSQSDTKLTISKFFEKYISEDNQSFEELHQKSLEEHRKQFHWVYEPQLLTNGEELQNNQQQQQRAGMLMLYYLGGKVLSEQERKKLDLILDGEANVGDERQNGCNNWSFNVRNPLMFYPELKDGQETCRIPEQSSDKNTYLPLPSSSGSNNRLLITDGKKNKADGQFLVPHKPSSKPFVNKKNDKIIQKENVFQSGMDFVHQIDSFFRDNKSMSTPSPLEAQHTPTTIASHDYELQAKTNPAPELDTSRYDFVSMSPMAFPGIGVLQSPLMTWGELAATPLLLERIENSRPTLPPPPIRPSESSYSTNPISSLSLSGPHFHILSTSNRELTARNLDEKFRSRIQQKTSTPKLPTSRESVLASPLIIAPSSHSSKKISSNSSVTSNFSKNSLKSKFESLTPAAKALALKLQNNKRNSF